MRALILPYVAALATILAMDALWLGVIGREFYRSRLGGLLLDQPLWLAAILFYLLHALGTVVFALPGASSLLLAAGRGFLYGVCVYAAYDLTNQATLRGWPLSVTLVDLAWGGIVTAAACCLAWLAARPS